MKAVAPMRWLCTGILLLLLAVGLRGAGPGVTSTGPSTTQSALLDIPEIVTLDQLQKAGQLLYSAVPFAHRRHAQMAQMWEGCTTCHHHTPEPGASTRPEAADLPTVAHTQADAAKIPACRSCHPVVAENPTISMPSLKGAYHRQCLNCHRDWMDANACTICHQARAAGAPATMPTADDIVGRMHPPIAAPVTRVYQARFTPVDGPNVLFRHEEHARRFSITCVTCHRHDSCNECHRPLAKEAASASAPATAATSFAATALPGIPPGTLPERPVSEGSHPLKPGRTWLESHGPCIACHTSAPCKHCHYPNEKNPPPEFDHARSQQTLDKDHAALRCAACHPGAKTANISCVDSSCHQRKIAWPGDLPGPRPSASTATAISNPAATDLTPPATTSPASQPATRPTVIRIRRGGR